MAFVERQLVIAVIDLAHFVQSVRGLGAAEISVLVDRYYREVNQPIADAGGRIVKYFGDGILAVFPPDRASDAVVAAERLRAVVEQLAEEFGLPLELGVNMHLTTVAEGTFGPNDSYDIMGAGVNHAFRMGAGAGTRISEPVYRKLPSEARGDWDKHQPPATYTLAAR